MAKIMRHFGSLLFMLLFSYHGCSAQNEKIKLSSIINSMYFSKDRGVVPSTEKMLFCMSFPQKAEMDKLEEAIDFDLFDSKEFLILYGNDKKKILKELKHVEYGNVIDIKIINRESSELGLSVNMSNTDYKLFRKMQFKVVTMDSDWEIHYSFKDGEWVTTKMICNGF